LTLLSVVEGESNWAITEDFEGIGFTLNFENKESLLRYLTND
jgi:hypothetical protein